MELWERPLFRLHITNRSKCSFIRSAKDISKSRCFPIQWKCHRYVFSVFSLTPCAVFDVRNRGNTSASVNVEVFILIRFLAIFAHPASFKKFKRGRRADKTQEKKKTLEITRISRVWSEWRASNSRLPAPKAGALPTAPHPVIWFSVHSKDMRFLSY